MAFRADKNKIQNVFIVLIKMITGRGTRFLSGRKAQMQKESDNKELIMCLCYHQPHSLHTVIVFYNFVPDAQLQFPPSMMAYVP